MAYTGTVKKWLPKGYGFIEPENGGGDVFCHIKNVNGDREYLNIGEVVTFDTEVDERSQRERANNVTGDGSGEAPNMDDQGYNNRYNNNYSRGGGYNNRGGGYNRRGGNRRGGYGGSRQYQGGNRFGGNNQGGYSNGGYNNEGNDGGYRGSY